MRVPLTQNVWTEITDESKLIQNSSRFEILFQIAETAPTTIAGINLKPLEKMEFVPGEEKLWGFVTAENCEVEVFQPEKASTKDENSDDILAAVEKLAEDNFEDDITAVETWLELPENIKGVSFILDCTDNTEATLEYTFDRSASPSHSVESELGKLVNDKEGGYLAGAVAQVRMNDVVSNAVLEVKSSLPTDLVGDNNDLVFTSKLTGVEGDAITIAYIDPAQAGALSIVVTGTDIVVNLAHDGNAITTIADDISDAIALDPAADALVSVANKAANDGSGLVTAMAKTALTGGVNAVAATLPKLWIIGVK